ncbi:MAG: glycosyltransferase family 39 protein [Myxococcaceae bacterium]
MHPPGLLYLLGLTSSFAGAVDPARAFAAARLVATVIGAANVFLVGRLALRSAGPVAALVAAVLYATYPEVVVVERGPYLEPVLNLACLGLAMVWLSPRKERSWLPLLAGVLCGAAVAVKVWGGIWLLAALASAPRGRARNELPRFLGAAVVTGLLLVAPLALPSLRAFIEQTLLFHAWRPPDGGIDRLSRIGEIFNARHAVAAVLAMLGFVAIVVKRLGGWAGEVSREEHFFGAVWLLTLISFFMSAAYWSQYNSHLAASECVLAGLGAGAAWRLLSTRLPVRALSLGVPLLAAGLAFPSTRRCVLEARARAPELLAFGRAVRALVPARECLFSFEPGWGLVAGHLPPHEPGAPALVDTYGAMLLGAVREGARFPDAGAAFQSAGAQTPARARLESCRYAVMGWRGDWQLTGEDKRWFLANFTRHEAVGGNGLDLWERSSRLLPARSP